MPDYNPFSHSFGRTAQRGLSWISKLARQPLATYALYVFVFADGLLLRTIGLGRSLWLDEIWVANSVIAPTLRGMFYYEAWLQISPPLFLLLVRFSVITFGLANWVLRLTPLLMGLLSVIIMVALARRLLSPQHALLASVMFVLSPTALEFSRALKQYSSELAAATGILLFSILYLERASLRRFCLLVTGIVTGLLLAYPAVFLLPGAVLTVLCVPARPYSIGSRLETFQLNRWARAAVLGALGAGTLMAENFLFIAPNTSSALKMLYVLHHGSNGFGRIVGSDYSILLLNLPLGRRMTGKLPFVGAAVALLLVVGAILAYLRFLRGRRKWLQVQAICIIPCILLVAADSFSRYPLVQRTSLFTLPFVVLLVVSCIQLVCNFVVSSSARHIWRKAICRISLLGLTLIVIRVGFVSPAEPWLKMPYEDMDGAVSFLRTEVKANDILWVHASTVEGFKLYARMKHWNDAPVRYGHTGWPCCPRGISNIRGASAEDAVRKDIADGIPQKFAGRVWLLYTMRTAHWELVGLDEPEIIKAVLAERGCLQQPTADFNHIGVSLFDCGSPPE